ncbi:hypothetical protein FRC08_009916 [Ceratobasidium sp. 394]|nr:hypothetical protein FRC08_009916 [Ceratobasidium sp. 394]
MMPKSTTRGGHNLPLDLLSLIFTMIVHSAASARYAGDKRYGSIDYPILLASVCSYWRRTAINTPMLWNYVDLTRSRDPARSFEYAKLYIERSRNLPLRVYMGKLFRKPDATERIVAIKVPSVFSARARKLPGDMRLLLIENSPRMRSLALNATCTHIVIDVLSTLFLGGAGDSLRELALKVDTAFQVSPPITTQLGQLTKPLRILHLQGLQADLNFIPCGNLVELCLDDCDGFTAADVAIFLNSNPSLCSVNFNCQNYPRLPASGSVQKIHLPNLRSLDFSGWADFTTWFFGGLETGPHALDFRFCLYDTISRSTLIDFFKRTPIVTLRLTAHRLPLSLFLASSPRIQRLELDHWYIVPNTFDGIEDIVDKVTELHTIGLVGCLVGSYTDPNPGFRALLTLPSVQKINYFECGDSSIPGNQDMFRELLMDTGITAQVVEAPELGYDASPFISQK